MAGNDHMGGIKGVCTRFDCYRSKIIRCLVAEDVSMYGVASTDFLQAKEGKHSYA